MNKKLIRLTESDLHRIVKESTNRILKESVSRNEKISKIHLTSIRPGRLGNPRFLVQGISEFGNSFEGKTSENANFVYNCERFEGKTCQVQYHTSRNGDYIVDNMRPVQGLPESVIRELEELPGINDPHGLTGLEGDDEMSWSIHNIENAISNMDGSLLEQLVGRYNGLGKVIAKWLAENVGENRLRKDIPGFDYFINN